MHASSQNQFEFQKLENQKVYMRQRRKESVLRIIKKSVEQKE